MTVQAWQQIFERVEREARALDPAKTILTVLSVPFLIVGFAAAVAVQVLWMAVAFGWAGGLVGWQEAGGWKGPRLRKRRVSS